MKGLLLECEVRELATGTKLEIFWPGQNEGNEYSLKNERGKKIYAENHKLSNGTSVDKIELSFIGIKPYHVRVRLVE